MVSAPLIEIISWFAAMISGELTTSTGRNRTTIVAVEPLVELGRPGGERGDRVAVEGPLLAVGHLAGLVQVHEAGGEHLRVHAVVAPAAGRERS